MKAVLVAAGAVLAVPAYAQALKGAEIKTLISGKSATWESKVEKSRRGDTTWNADGTMTVSGNFDGFSSDSGKWSIKGDRYCATFKRIRGGKEACSPISKMPDGRYDFGNSIGTLR